MAPPHRPATADAVSLLRFRAEHEPDRLAANFLQETGRADIGFSYRQLDQQARRVGAGLIDRHLSGKRALLLFQPGPDCLIGLLGCWYAGVTAVPAYAPRPNASMARIHLICKNAEAAAILSTSALLAMLESALLGATLQIAMDAIDDGFADQWHMPSIGADTLAVMQYTSGSSGDPKGVCLRHGHLVENSRSISLAMHTSPESVGVFWLPPFHDMGLIGSLLQPLYAGFPAHLMTPAAFLQRPMRWLQALSRYRGTISAAPNFAYELCVQRARPEQILELDLSSWKLAANGAEPVLASTLRRFTLTFAPAGFDGRAFFPCYGMAEATLMVTGGHAQAGGGAIQVDRKTLAAGTLVSVEADGVELVSCGRPVDGTAVVIVDPQTLCPCAEDRVGEIWVSSASVADGYWGHAELSAANFGVRLAGSQAAWLRTGDLGALHCGELHVTGRIKELIIIRGFNHSPRDIEATATAAHPMLRSHGAAAFGVAEPEGESLGLVLEMARGWQPDDLATARMAVLEAVSRVHQLQVAHLVFVKAHSVPTTSSGKVRRLDTRERWLSGALLALDNAVPA